MSGRSQLVDRMHVKADFSAVKVRQAAPEHIHRQSLVGQGAVAGGKNVIVDAAGEQGGLDRDMLGIEIQTQIALQAVFRLQVLVADLEPEGPFVLSVRTQFGQIRRAETAGDVGPEGEMLP